MDGKECQMFRLSSSALLLICLMTGFDPVIAKPPQQAPAQAPPGRAARPPAPTRDPNTPGYVKAKELADGAVPSAKEDGNFILGPTHNPAAEMSVKEGIPQGQ